MTKVISLSNAAYETMKSFKEQEESFSDVVIKLAERSRKQPITHFFGRWPGTAAEAEHIKKKIEKDRKQFKTHEVHFK